MSAFFSRICSAASRSYPYRCMYRISVREGIRRWINRIFSLSAPALCTSKSKWSPTNQKKISFNFSSLFSAVFLRFLSVSFSKRMSMASCSATRVSIDFSKKRRVMQDKRAFNDLWACSKGSVDKRIGGPCLIHNCMVCSETSWGFTMQEQSRPLASRTETNFLTVPQIKTSNLSSCIRPSSSLAARTRKSLSTGQDSLRKRPPR
mmetsp:Transcript_31693/g.62709  ORF Transcript_31693/g.62709 Transcript_31693/m.62709 type:complete len:205 (+) Transcript_31693:239-853(+)